MNEIREKQLLDEIHRLSNELRLYQQSGLNLETERLLSSNLKNPVIAFISSRYCRDTQVANLLEHPECVDDNGSVNWDKLEQLNRGLYDIIKCLVFLGVYDPLKFTSLSEFVTELAEENGLLIKQIELRDLHGDVVLI